MLFHQAQVPAASQKPLVGIDSSRRDSLLSWKPVQALVSSEWEQKKEGKN